jgi:hypothetical protein
MDAMPLLAQCRHARHVVGRGHGQKIAGGGYPATRFAAAQVRRALLPLAAEVVVLAWSTRRMQQDRLKIRSQRQGLLPSARPRVGLCR